MPLLLCKFRVLQLEVHQTKNLAIQTNNWTKFIYTCTDGFATELYSLVFSKGGRKNNDENMEVEN